MDKAQLTEIVKRVMSEGYQKNSDIDAEKMVSRADNVTLRVAKILINRVLKRAEEIGVKAVCAVVNSGANPVAVEVADGAYIASYDIALNKAYTSASLLMKTSQLKDLASPGGSLYGIQFTNQGRIVIFGGGIPLKAGDKVIGGFGVSGGSEEQDTYLGEYAEEVFRDIISANL